VDARDVLNLAHRLYPHIATAEADITTEALAERVESLTRGLLPEDEFAATAMWLGNCAAIHRIDQSRMPLQVAPDEMRAPDFLAFPIVNDRPMPILIEVKSAKDVVLDWSEKYLASLRRFADLLGLPLLVAWKWGDNWTLVDHRHFEKNLTAYRLTLVKAFKQDVMCVLFRDLRVMMNPEIELTFDFEMLDEVAGHAGDLIPTGQFKAKIAGVGFYRNGKKMTGKLDFALFLATPSESEFRRTSKQTCQQIYRPVRDTGFTLSRVLVAQLSAAAEGDLNWHQILARGKFPSNGSDVRNSLQAGLDQGFVQYVMDVVPNTWPDFLPPRSNL
jgi:hypothetical protein